MLTAQEASRRKCVWRGFHVHPVLRERHQQLHQEWHLVPGGPHQPCESPVLFLLSAKPRFSTSFYTKSFLLWVWNCLTALSTFRCRSGTHTFSSWQAARSTTQRKPPVTKATRMRRNTARWANFWKYPCLCSNGIKWESTVRWMMIYYF